MLAEMETPQYRTEPDLGAGEFIDLLIRSALAERRPVDDLPRIEAMLRNADLILAARVGGLLVGAARAITDFSYCCYLADLAVDEAFQNRGIGRELLRRVADAAGPGAKLILLAAPKAAGYYPRLGMVRHESCWVSP